MFLFLPVTSGMSEETADERVAKLEERLSGVEDQLERYREQHALLVADADIDALGEPRCPECGEEQLERRSGISWAKVSCRGCETEWILNG